ncbi:SdpI family protein [Glutamicibacter sp. NPDC087344]|uniref:SdpI family protein n=1 Tax=Glutamicibacter sp. NPDC087344 TaxID=3363994 RepID=UPI0037F49768
MDLLSVIPFMLGLLTLTAISAGLAPSMSAGRLTRNSAIGIKTRHTLATDDAWLSGHAAAAPLMKLSGRIGWVFLLLATAFCLFGSPGWAFAITGVGYVVALTLLFVATAKANAAARSSG